MVIVHMTSILACRFKVIGAFDFKRCCIEWSVYDIKVPREPFESMGTTCSLIAPAVFWCHTLDHSMQRRLKSNAPYGLDVTYPNLQRCPLVSTAFFVLFRFSVWNAGTMVVKRVTEKNERSRCTAQLFLHLDFSALSLSAFTQSPFHLSLHKNLTFLYDSLFLPFLPPGCVVDCLTPLGE